MSLPLKSVGRSERRVDSVKLATGRGTFVDDIALPGLLHARILHSPHAHARIARIDAAPARALPGVACVLTHLDVPRVPYTSAGQGWPEPSPYDAVMLDSKVRFVGDRVAVVAADDPELALRACQAIKVDYEPLPALFDPELAMAPGAPVIHDEADASGIKDAARNLAAALEAEVGSVAEGFAQAERVFEQTYRVPYVQQASIEPHEPDRDRKLLLHRRQIDQLGSKVAERGLTLVPTRLYFKNGRVKVELALARGKEGRDKRRDIAERETKRRIDRELKTRR